MRVTRRGGAIPSRISGPTELHLTQGCCLMVGCQACSGPPGIAQAQGLPGWTFNNNAKRLWRLHRERILEIWRDPDALPTGTDFDAEAGRGCGRFFPCYAEVFFDGAEWPKLDRSWPPVVKKIWEYINDDLEAMRNERKD